MPLRTVDGNRIFVWEDTISADEAGHNKLNVAGNQLTNPVPLKEKRIPLQPIKSSFTEDSKTNNFTKIKLIASCCDITNVKGREESQAPLCSKSCVPLDAVCFKPTLPFTIFCDEGGCCPLPSSVVTDTTRRKPLSASSGNKFPYRDRSSSDGGCCGSLESVTKSPNNQVFASSFENVSASKQPLSQRTFEQCSQFSRTVTLDKENVYNTEANLLDDLPKALISLPPRAFPLAERRPLEPLFYISDAEVDRISQPDFDTSDKSDSPLGSTDSVFVSDLNCAETSSLSIYGSAKSSLAIYHTPMEAIDKEAHEDLIYCSPDYIQDIYAYLRQREQLLRSKSTYMKKQTDLNEAMRTVLVDWLVEVQQEYRLSQETLYLTINYIDRFLSLMTVTRNKLQLVGAASMYIASKFEEVYPPDINEFVYITDDSYTRKQVLKMEHLLLEALRFDMAAPTVNCFLALFLKANKAGRQTNFLAQYLCELSLLEYSYLHFLPSIIASSSICLANLTTGLIPWSEDIEQVTGYTVPAFFPCMKKMLASFRYARSLEQIAIREKYADVKYFKVAELTPPDSLPPISERKVKHQVHNYHCRQQHSI